MDIQTLIALLLFHPIKTLEQPIPTYETPVLFWQVWG